MLHALCAEVPPRKYFVLTYLMQHGTSINAINAKLLFSDPAWLEMAYSTAISGLDTGIVERGLDIANVLTAFLIGQKGAVVHDFGGGIGLLARIMRDRGFNCFSWDPMAEYSLPLPTRDVEVADVVTLIEVLEHLTNPVEIRAEISKITDTIFISTHLIPNSGIAKNWDYLQTETGQHIFFCSPKTLRIIGQVLGMEVTSNNKNLHVLHRRSLTISKRIVVKSQQLAWLFGQLSAMLTRGKSRAHDDAKKFLEATLKN